MPRKPRVQFPGAIYHCVARGDGRQELVHDSGHYERLTKEKAWQAENAGTENAGTGHRGNCSATVLSC